MPVGVGQVGASSFPAQLKLPRYPVPVLRIGRLAVDRGFVFAARVSCSFLEDIAT